MIVSLRMLAPTVLACAPVVVLALSSAVARADSPIKDDEEVVFFAAAAHHDGKGWRVPLHGWIFEPEEGSIWRAGILRGLGVALDPALGEADGARAAHRDSIVRWFLVDNERGKRLAVDVGGAPVVLSRSGADGHTRAVARIQDGAEGDWIPITTTARDGRRFTGGVQLVGARGVSVVSDIDDTIKVTEVLIGKRRVVERTFLEPFEAVPGMAATYDGWRRSGAVFHYVSGSPWQLYVPLVQFIGQAGFPPGTLHLREFRLKDSRRTSLLRSPRKHKLTEIAALLRRFPRRRFVLVGDTGESDPEVYGELARRFPRQVAAIALRRLPGDTYDGRRAARAMARVKSRVFLFESASELPALTDI